MHALTYWWLLVAFYVIAKWYAGYLKRCPYDGQAADWKPRAASPGISSHATQKGGQRGAEGQTGEDRGRSIATWKPAPP
jgi:hypothetical protein